MRAGYLFFVAAAQLGHAAPTLEPNCKDTIHALAQGNLADSPAESRGDVWLNITGFAGNELPHILESVGITSLDNARKLQVIAEPVQKAASQKQWGDVVFLFNVFSMNAHSEFSSVASPQMQAGLLNAVRDKTPDGGPDDSLIDLYASTSSSPSLVEAFRALANQYAKRQVEVDPSTTPAPDDKPGPTTPELEPTPTDHNKRQVEVDILATPEVEATPTLVNRQVGKRDDHTTIVIVANPNPPASPPPTPALAERQAEIPVVFRPSATPEYTVPEAGPTPTEHNKRQVEYPVPVPAPSPTPVDKWEANIDSDQLVFNFGHVAVSSACRSLIDWTRGDTSWKSGTPRNICSSGCCISWSVDATLQIDDLYNASHDFDDSCVNERRGASCEAHNMSLHGTSVNLCLSNRPDGCA